MTPNIGDGQLWSQAVAGNAEAFGVLFDRHAKRVYNHCFRLTASWATAEDMLQNTFLLAWRKLHKLQLEPDETALPWLLAVATNAVRTERRSLARRLRLSQRVAVDLPAEDPADVIASRIDDERRMIELLAAVRSLPSGQREALAMCVWAEVSYPDAATALGIKEVSVRARVSKAKAALAAQATGAVPVAAVAASPLEER